MDELLDSLIPTKVVKTPDGKFDLKIRGFSLLDLTLVVNKFGPIIGEVFDEVSDLQAPTENDIQTVISKFIHKAPELTTFCLYVALEKKIPLEKVSLIPAAFQIELLDVLIEMTLTVNGGLKKTVEIVMKLLNNFLPKKGLIGLLNG